jgi:hypothetical protein
MRKCEFRVIFVFLFVLCSIAWSGGTLLNRVAWGTGDKEIGLQKGEEIESVGPMTFSLDSLGQIYLLDFPKARISVLDKSGKHLKNIGTGIRGSSLAIDPSGIIGVLNGNALALISSSGARQDISVFSHSDIVEGYGQHLKYLNGSFYRADVKQNLWESARISNKSYQSVSLSAAPKQITGIPSSIANITYKVDVQDTHTVYITASSGAEFKLKTSYDWGGVQILGITSKGEIILEAEQITPDNYVHLFLYRLDSQGQTTGMLEIPNKYATTVYKKNELLPDGTILQMLTTDQGVEFWSWQF